MTLEMMLDFFFYPNLKWISIIKMTKKIVEKEKWKSSFSFLPFHIEKEKWKVRLPFLPFKEFISKVKFLDNIRIRIDILSLVITSQNIGFHLISHYISELLDFISLVFFIHSSYYGKVDVSCKIWIEVTVLNLVRLLFKGYIVLPILLMVRGSWRWIHKWWLWMFVSSASNLILFIITHSWNIPYHEWMSIRIFTDCLSKFTFLYDFDFGNEYLVVETNFYSWYFLCNCNYRGIGVLGPSRSLKDNCSLFSFVGFSHYDCSWN